MMGIFCYFLKRIRLVVVTCIIGMLHSPTHVGEMSGCVHYCSAIGKRFGLDCSSLNQS